MSTRTAIAAGLVACYGAACAWSLWNRAHAIEFFVAVSVLSAGFIFSSMFQRVLIGVVISTAAAALGVFLPGIGDLIDAAAALVATFFMLDKFKRFGRNLVAGIGCFLLYAILWSAGGHLPRQYAVRGAGAHHEFWFYLALITISSVAGVLFLLLVVAIGKLFDDKPTRTVFYTVGYPWYLLIFIITYFIPDSSVDDASDD